MDWIRRNFALKVAAVLTAVILWFTFNYLSAGSAYIKTLDLPLTLHGVSAGLIGSTKVHDVAIELTGPRPQIEGLTPQALNAFVDCAGKTEGTFALNVTVVGPGSDKIHAVTPPQAVVVLDRYAYRRVPVISTTFVDAAATVDLDPKSAIVAGSQTKVSQVFAVQVNLDESAAKHVVLELKAVPVDAHFAPIGGLTVAPADVRVTIVPRKGHA